MKSTMILLLQVLLLLLLTPVASIQTNITSLCSPHATPPLLIRGQPTFVCINVNDQYRTLFTPTADHFTVLRIANSWNDSRIGGDASGAYLSVSSMAARSTYKLYASDRGLVYPYMTAIISVKQGVVQGVTWDDGCYFCDPETCEPNLYRAPTNRSSQLIGQGYTCFNNIAQCGGGTENGNSTTTNALTCDITLYVGWTGTDKNGNYLSSAGLRMSQFQKYSISSYFKNLKYRFESFMPSSRFEN